jgi:uncharacterized protein YndB with AHSA1/START domain
MGVSRGSRRRAENTMCIVTAVFALATVQSDASAAQGPPDESWELVRSSGRVNLYERPIDGGELDEAFAQTTVDAPPARVLKVLQDYATFPEWSPYTEETRLIRHEGDSDLVFQRMDLPWPVGNRYYTIRFLKTELPGGGIRLEWDLAAPADRVECDCGVETPRNHGAWTLEPLGDGGRTLVSCQALTDPGGRLPKWAFRMANGRIFPKLLTALGQRALLPKYAPSPITPTVPVSIADPPASVTPTVPAPADPPASAAPTAAPATSPAGVVTPSAASTPAAPKPR